MQYSKCLDIKVSVFKKEDSPVAEVANVNLEFNFITFFMIGSTQKERTIEIVGSNKMLLFDDIRTNP